MFSREATESGRFWIHFPVPSALRIRRRLKAGLSISNGLTAGRTPTFIVGRLCDFTMAMPFIRRFFAMMTAFTTTVSAFKFRMDVFVYGRIKSAGWSIPFLFSVAFISPNAAQYNKKYLTNGKNNGILCKAKMLYTYCEGVPDDGKTRQNCHFVGFIRCAPDR